MRGCGFAYPPGADTPAREQMDRFLDFLRIVGPPGNVTPHGRWLVQNDPELRGYVYGAFPLIVDDVRA